MWRLACVREKNTVSTTEITQKENKNRQGLQDKERAKREDK